MQNDLLLNLIEQGVQGIGCTAQEAAALIDADEAALFDGATLIREAHFGNRVQLCCIINAKSGRCDMDCRFCSQSAHNTTDIDTYPFLEPQALESSIREAIASGDRKCGVVTSGGRLSDEELEDLTDVVRAIDAAGPCPVCGSLGRLGPEALGRLKDAGMTRYHHNLETSEAYYTDICSTQTWSSRVDTVKAAQAAGLLVCSGGLFGLGEAWDDRIDLALTLRELGVDSVPINFLYAHPGTPLGDQPPLSAEEALRIIALYRFVLPDVTLRVCGGRAHVLGDRQSELFAAGANGVMTGNYLTVKGSQYETDLEMIRALGLDIAPC